MIDKLNRNSLAEPLIHSSVTDCLPDHHPLQKTADDADGLFCVKCNTMVHFGGNNENMRTWVETGQGAYCLACFAQADKEGWVYSLGIPISQREMLGNDDELAHRVSTAITKTIDLDSQYVDDLTINILYELRPYLREPKRETTTWDTGRVTHFKVGDIVHVEVPKLKGWRLWIARLLRRKLEYENRLYEVAATSDGGFVAQHNEQEA